MEWVLGIGFLGAIAYLWERAKRGDVEKELALSQALARDLKRQFHEELERAERSELAIAQLHQDLRELNEDLEKCAVPGVARERLARLLATQRRRTADRL